MSHKTFELWKKRNQKRREKIAMYKTYDDILNAVVDHGAMIVRPATAKD
jgi:hypothetical protein